MKNKYLVFSLSIFLLTGLATAASNQNVSVNESVTFENGDVQTSVGVGHGNEKVVDKIFAWSINKTVNGSSVSVEPADFSLVIDGNASDILRVNDYPNLPSNSSANISVFGDGIGSSQPYGWYNGTLNVSKKGNGFVNDSISVSVRVDDEVKPEFNNVDFGDLMATNSRDLVIDVTDNLNVSFVEATFLRQEVVNQTTGLKENTSVSSKNLTRSSDGSFKGVFTESGEIGSYWLKLTAGDESGNQQVFVESFNVNGLDSTTVLSDNFVFDTFQVKDESSFKFVENSQDKPFSITLNNLSYGGNESVNLGVLPPGADSPEVFDSGESRNYSDEGVYKLVLIHSGSDEVKGTHRVTGEVFVEKPGHHVAPVNVSASFSGTVKNLDKPSSTCERVKEFDGCVGYGLDQVRKLFDEEYNLSDDEDKSFAYLIGRIPTSDVEGSDKWGDELSLTFGEYNETVQQNTELKNRVDSLESSNGFKAALLLWLPFLLVGLGGGLFVYYLRVGQYIAFAQSKQKIIEKASVKEPKEGLN